MNWVLTYVIIGAILLSSVFRQFVIESIKLRPHQRKSKNPWRNGGGAGKFPKRENWLYPLQFCILSKKKHSCMDSIDTTAGHPIMLCTVLLNNLNLPILDINSPLYHLCTGISVPPHISDDRTNFPLLLPIMLFSILGRNTDTAKLRRSVRNMTVSVGKDTG